MKERILSAIERYLARKVSTTITEEQRLNIRAGEQNGASPRYPAARNYLR